jgi:hypothetical protein
MLCIEYAVVFTDDFGGRRRTKDEGQTEKNNWYS